ncbi:MAG: response regulator [Deltaproteobacteria bacterium]|nr:response regulator [Deltaproteobacteria bacterium]
MDKPRVLIVDDEVDMRIFISTLFETNGYKAFPTQDGQSGLKKAKEITPDLIILDVMMPGEGGVKMFQGLKSDQALARIPVIMLSAVAQKTFTHYLTMLNLRMDGRLTNPDAYVEKPPDADELLSIAKSLTKPSCKTDGVV